MNKKENEMYDLITSVVLYDSNYSDIEKYITQYFEKNVNQKLVFVDNSEEDKIRGYINDIVGINKYDIDYIFSGDNLGYGKGNNLAINKYVGQGKYFLISNLDIEFSIESIKQLIEQADMIGEFGVLMPKISYRNGENQYACRLLPTPMNLFGRRFLKFMKNYVEKIDYFYEYKFSSYKNDMIVPYLSGCFMFTKYDNLIKENGFDKRYFMYMEDVDLSRRMFKYTNRYIANIEVFHDFKKESHKSKKMTLAHMKSAVQYFNKWGWIFDKERKKINKEMVQKYGGGE